MIEQLVEQVKSLVNPIIEKRNAFLVGIQIRIGHKSKTVQIFADTDNGITIDECAELSREIGAVLESSTMLEGMYQLEVSSPGVEKPLKNLRQFPRNIGRTFTVTYLDGDEKHSFVGVLEKIEGTLIYFRLSNAEVRSIEFEKILETKVKLPW